MRIFLQIIVLTSMIFLSGCVLVPGSHLNPTSATEDSNWFENDGEWFPGIGADSSARNSDIEDIVDIFAITPDLVQQYSNDHLISPTSGISIELQSQVEEYEYRIGRGDTLYITVYDHPELTAPAGIQNQNAAAGNIVRSDGTIFYPYIGSVHAEGQTVEDVRAEITLRLDEFINDPQVDLRVLNYRSQKAYITGQVSSPGPLPITDIPLTLLDAVIQSGGLTENANWHNVQLIRSDGERVALSLYEIITQGDLGSNLLLNHGDVLNIPDIGNQKVFMLGEIGTVRSIPMGNLRMSLTDAISQSGGIDQIASDASGIFVIRQADSDSGKLATVYQLNARDAIAFAVGAKFMLLPEDVVFVTTAPVTRWNRVLSQIVPSISTLLLIERAGFN